MNIPQTFHKQSETWQNIKTNWLIRAVNRVVLVLNIASVICIAAFWNRLPPLIPLWYSKPWGADQLAHPLWLIILPAGSILLYFLNLGVTIFFTAEYLIFTQVAFLTSLLVSLLSFVALIKILSLVI
jgi:hypothetical protein